MKKSLFYHQVAVFIIEIPSCALHVKSWRTRLFSSTDLENIRVGYERPPWGFWDREAGGKQRRNWRSFVKARHKKGKRL
ncbi:MAG: hypothetical protein LM590_13080 [Thermofilum sp.]|nr:hypothetical protein [Thermofilum sp.]